MDPKPVEETIALIFQRNMKRSASELDMEKFLTSKMNDNNNNNSHEVRIQKAKICGETQCFLGVQGQEKCFQDVCASDLIFTFGNQVEVFNDGRGIQELQIITKELNFRNRMDVDYLLNYPGEKDTTSEILTRDEIIESITGNDQDDEAEDDSSTLEPVSRKEALKVEKMNTFSNSGGGLTESSVWTQNPVSMHPAISATIDSQSSMCGPASSGITFARTATGSAGSPTSAHKSKSGDNQARGTTSTASSREQSDDDDIEIDGGSCGQSIDPLSVKKIRRMVSNRESARRSRRRKQAHLVDLETQVDQLRVENGSLYKQFADANRQFSEATTDNRVLKSDVEALRVKVKLAEDMVARGSLTCSLNHLLQSYSSPSQPINSHDLFQASKVSPSLGVRGDEASYMNMSDSGHVSGLGLEDVDTGHGSIKHRLNRNMPLVQRNTSLDQLQNLQSGISEAVSCLSDNWT